jgi:hypothetical protein
MSRTYGKVAGFFWQNPKTRRLSHPASARELLLYMFSSPHGNSIGCFIGRIGYFIEDLGWDRPEVEACLRELTDAGHIERDEETGLIRVVGWFEHNYFENENVAKAAGNAFKALPVTNATRPILDNLIRELSSDRSQVAEKYRKVFDAVATASILTEPNRTEPTHAARRATPVSRDESEKDFDEWYRAYPRHDDRGHGLKAYIAARKKPGVTKELLLAGARGYAEEKSGTEKQYIALPATWLNGERWKDAGVVGRSNGNGEYAQWRQRLKNHHKTGFWLPDSWGPPPGQPGCRVPPELLLTTVP